MKQTYWPGSNIVKSTGNAFTAKPIPQFADDPTERAKMNVHQKRLDILRPATSQITVGKRYNGEIPNAFKRARSK